ncbi:hypothetical protein PT974_06276 [Cladobotryum mycophilum]|uniref:Uncharacterized protein n=1 Tax=Cladobotryum mycophilum TaxID=491253 RepID=A0ABR0SLE3_9HYPO
MSAFDQESRLKAVLQTANGAYDQGLALSQGVINVGFEGLYNKYDELKRITWNDLGVEMDAELLPSRILIPGDLGMNLAKIHHQIRFKSGYIRNVNNTVNIDLTDWMIAVVCDLDMQFIDRNPDDESETERKQREFIEREFDIPGDYRIDRFADGIYSTAANWNHFDMDNSRFINPDTGREWSFDDWADHDNYTATMFSMMCSSWARSMQAAGLTTLGVQLSLPDLTETPTFTPTTVIHQIYPYRGQDGKAETGFTPRGNSNSFLYLEMVKDEEGNDGVLPDAKQVAFSGNFCYPGAGSTPAMDGTFIISHKLFMERYLVPVTQAVNVSLTSAIRLINNSPFGWVVPLRIGTDPDYPDPNHEIHKFSRSEDGKSYVFRKVRPQQFGPESYNGRWLKVNHDSITTTAVTWDEGSDARITISGNIGYFQHNQLSTTEDFLGVIGWSKLTVSGLWSIKIQVSAEDGALVIGLAPGAELSINIEVDTDKTANMPYPLVELPFIQQWMELFLQARVQAVVASLQKSFSGKHQFVQPGSGQLDFSEPKFNYNGDLISSVKHKAFTGEKVMVPARTIMKLEPLDDPESKTIDVVYKEAE